MLYLLNKTKHMKNQNLCIIHMKQKTERLKYLYT